MDLVNFKAGLPGLKNIREFLGLSQNELAREIIAITANTDRPMRTHQDYVSSIETGKADCSLRQLRYIAQAVACEPHELLAPPDESRLSEIKASFLLRQAAQLMGEAGK